MNNFTESEKWTVLGVLAVGVFLFFGAAYFWVKTPVPLPPPQPQDAPSITIQHDDGWVTNIICLVGRDPNVITTQRTVGIADCPHDELGINQYLKNVTPTTK